MLLNVFDKYKELFTFKSLYLKHINKRKLVFMCILSLMLCILIYYVYIRLEVAIILLFLCWPFLIFIPFFFSEVKRIIVDVYHKKDRDDFLKYRKKIFEKYLNELELDDPKKLEVFIKMIDRKAEENKPKFFISRGIIAGIFAPIWIAYINRIFNDSISNFQEATVIFIFMVFIIALIMGISYMIKPISDELMNGEYLSWNSLSNLIREVYIKKL
ncbi:hypothetical protein [Sporosalibacterium faouarense]|uniref:hypothetical protein n=1 Tax=Sporosalibacterium faouarense TaxID=516123 RepID=UPI00192CA65D|nr:hypothetical protein [Sporosalibacterium faouarense]